MTSISEKVLAEAERLYGDLQNTNNVTPPKMVNIDKLDLKGPTVEVVEGKWE